jgi:hypothetical protein
MGRSIEPGDAPVVMASASRAVAGDLRYPNEILCHRDVLRLIDFTRPVAVILGMVFHFYEASAARRIVKQFISGIVPGSYVVMSVARGEEDVGDRVAEAYTAGQVHNHSVEVVRTFMMDLELMDPGLTDARWWRSDNQTPGSEMDDRGASVWAGVGKKITA